MSNLKRISGTISNEMKDGDFILSFEQFLENVEKNPWLYIRSSAQYLKDCFDYFGSYEVRTPSGKMQRWKMFDFKSDDSCKIHGQEFVQNAIYSHISAFAKRGRCDKIIMLHGPNATAKSSIIAAIQAGLSKY